jgi:hypothetical protein
VAKHSNNVKEFLDMLSEFSTIQKKSNGKNTEYVIPNLLIDRIPNLEKIKKLTKTCDIIISNTDTHEITLRF